MTTSTLLTYTFVVEFRGGTYCTQVQAINVDKAIVAWTEKLKVEKSEIKQLGDKTIGEIIILSEDEDHKPIPLTNLVNIWFTNYPTNQGSFSVNIIQTDTSI